ncbi:uncharacterized protein BT62DRAFT_316311 [Guyanagaster necrorhizus]|uniref:Uncharacterized protein n=1 Tax=Guyanagaster necrorhizus TaxID=856835 RepID=A0A9P8AR61_9AGAR|nr:uncharacterized protein BT62DRAFT_316311 [Guyanagaster necrorhizus MCA 3950]KAG7443542.1 hypothetical protein BT62DRAFT_316311 [Guyanagaster necrorhizus MCA 3950]
MSTTTRRLSTRRGSISANDPYGIHENHADPESTSRLSILRVTSTAMQLKPPPAPRLSFASSSFNQPSSPRRASQSISHALTPDELVQLARSPTESSPALQPTFTPLPDDILLPFIDRPAEVSALISSPPSSRLFALLQLTFTGTKTHSAVDPAKWSYAQLHDWLVKTTREEASDTLWVAYARACILAHSELIWERVKGALGIPPELDISDDGLDTSDMEDGGRKAKGRWEDWDAIMESSVGITQQPSVERPTLSPSSSSLHIEPILSSPAASPFYSSPSNNTIGLGGIKEEEESVTSTTPSEDEEAILPAQIHGLRISTTPSQSTSTSRAIISPAPSPTVSRRSSTGTRRPSFGTSTSPHSRSPVLTGRRSRPSSISSFSTLSLGQYPSNVEERTSPLFPSSFAALKSKGKALI